MAKNDKKSSKNEAGSDPKMNRDKRYGNRKPFKKKETGAPAFETRKCMGSKENDPSWYAMNPQLLKDAASFPYAWPLGNELKLGSFAGNFRNAGLPGIMRMDWVPTIGYASDGTDPVNVASINIYTKVRHDNSGHANYDHADYMMYLLAMDSVYAFHSWMRRVYGTMLTYSNTNRYFPRAAVKTMGVDFDQLQANMADFRQYINVFAVKASALAIPANMSIMTKHYWMSAGMYYDSNQAKSQTYIFNPIGFYKFGLNEGTKAGELTFAPLTYEFAPEQMPTTKELTFQDIVKYGDALLAPIISDEDFGIMSGDTLKSFGVGGCYTLPITEETYTVAPSYVPEVLDQIQNATFVGMPVATSMTIGQDPTIGKGWIKADPKFQHPWSNAAGGNEWPGQNAFLIDRFLTFEIDKVEPSNTMEASRWTNICDEVTSDQTKEYRVPTMGTEVMCCAWITTMSKSSASSNLLEPRMLGPIYVSMNIDAVAETDMSGANPSLALKNALTEVNHSVGEILMLTQMLGVFDRHPPVYLSSYLQLGIKTTASSSPVAAHSYEPINGVLTDVNYYTILSKSDLEEMSHIALLSEFNVTPR